MHTQPNHLSWLCTQSQTLLSFFDTSVPASGHPVLLDFDGVPIISDKVELHTVTRLIHAFAMGHAMGYSGAADLVDRALDFLLKHHLDQDYGGFHWTVEGLLPVEGPKLAYGHVFVLLAASSAHQIGHPKAATLLEQVSEILTTRFWEPSYGRFADEFTRDWQPFSDYRGINANMHGVEGLMAAFEATHDNTYLTKADQIIGFFLDDIAPRHEYRLPEHYTSDWQVDQAYAGDPMFRPAGTTPGHSFEWGRLALQHWDLSGRPDNNRVTTARRLIARADKDAWLPDEGLAYTLKLDGSVAIADRYWWPVAEAIGAYAALLKIQPTPEDLSYYTKYWHAAEKLFIDEERGGWYCEVDAAGAPVETQFIGKCDIYHALQASLFPQLPNLSRPFDDLKALQ